MATSIDNVVLVFSARGVTRVARQINEVGVASGKATVATNGLRGSLGALGALLAVRQVTEYADSVTELENRLRLVSDTSEEVVFRTQEIFDIASRTRGNLEETSRTFFRFARANERLGLSEKELLQITETVNQAVAFSGTTAESAASALFQFSQGIAAGTLRGQELNSVLEQIPGLAEVIARGLGVGVDQLRALGAAGELTGKQIAESLLSQGGFAAEQFGRITFTVTQEMERFRTRVIEAIGSLDDAVGFTDKLTASIRFLTDNLDLLGKSLLLVGTLMARAFSASVVRSIKAVTLAIAANPFGALAVAISTAVTALTIFREEIVVIEEGGVTLGTVMEVTWGRIKDFGVAAFEAIKGAAGTFFEELEDTQAFQSLGINFERGLNATLDVLRDWVNPAIGLLTLPLRFMINNFEKLPRAIGDIVFQTLETMRQVIVGAFDFTGFFSGLTDFIIDSFKSAFTFAVEFGKEAFETISNLEFELPDITLPEIDLSFLDTELENQFEGGLEAFADGVEQVIKDTFSRDFAGEASAIFQSFRTNFLNPFVEDLKKAQAAKDKLSQEVERRQASDVRPDLGPQPPDAKVIKEIEKLTERFQTQTDKLRESLDFLRLYRDEVEKFPESFKVSVEEVDAAISELERRISGTVDLQIALWETAADAGRTALVDLFMDPLNASLKDLAFNFVKTMQRVVAEALAAQAVLAALNFFQGFTSFRIPGATAAIPGSQFGQTAIAGMPRMVGEDGPEVVVPQSRSSVIPNSALGGTDPAIPAQLASLSEAISNLELKVVNVNQQDPKALLSTLGTQDGVKVQRNFVTTDQRQVKRTLGVR